MLLSEKLLPYINDINRSKLISIEDMVSFFNDTFFNNCSALIINGYGAKDTIIPSLSFYFEKSEVFKSKIFASTSEVYAYIQKYFARVSNKNEKQISDLFQTISNQNGKTFIKYFDESQILIISENEELFRLPEFETVTTFLFLAKRNSLNLLNSSYTFTLTDLTEVEKFFSQSIAETVNGFRQFFEEQYQGIEAYVCYKDFERRRWKMISKGKNKISLRKISKSIGLVDYQKPVYQKSQNDFYLLLPFCNDKRTYILKYVLILKSASRVPRYVVTNYLKFTNNYFNAFLEKEKRICLNELQSNIIDLLNKQRYLDADFDAHSELNLFAKQALNSTIHLTNAFSATLWLYNPNNECLDLSAENDVIENLNHRGTDTRSIPLKTINSVTVDTFKKSDQFSKDQHILVPDTKKRGLRLPNSNSELCFPFYFKNVKIGVVNFESADKNGFDKDSIQYCKNIRNLIQSFYVQLLETNDKVWLSRRTQIYQNYHEIENIINSPDFPLEYKTELSRLIQQQQISLDHEYDTLEKLVDLKENFFSKIIDLTPTDVYRKFHQNVFIKIDEDILVTKIRKFVVDSLIIIFKNILTNHRKYSEVDRDQLNIRITKDLIHFNIRSSRPLLNQENKKYLIAPFETSKNNFKRTHYGLFTIGMLARQLGGYSNIFFNWQRSKTYLRISIPVQKSWIQIQCES